MKVILLFPSIHYVLKAEKILKKQGVPLELIPVPKELSGDCGMALRIEEDSLQKALASLPQNLSPQKIYRQNRGFFERLEL